ncbi:manganese efflux pump MntP family protein [Candidatus Methanoprimaticola sp. MG2]|uniref:manganese efflux pump MntP n=1 Tax=Candidatus Methanoprimaticola sp. MG2 TaxID=3228838 RepID=UPI0039C61B9F
MDVVAVFLIAIGLAMDAFAVAICKGLAMGKPTVRSMLVIGLWFGVFQGLMPVIGYLLGDALYDTISDFDHWIAFILLAVIGVNMIREGLSGEEEGIDASTGFRTMLVLAVATSIDALAVGITLAMTEGSIYSSALIIGVVTFLISVLGVRIGSVFGDRFGSKAEIAGGLILIAIGCKILFEHLGFI